jgi:hypothetical protein
LAFLPENRSRQSEANKKHYRRTSQNTHVDMTEQEMLGDRPLIVVAILESKSANGGRFP